LSRPENSPRLRLATRGAPRRLLRRSQALFALLLLTTSSFGCWEQWSEEWWPQMKWQKAIQAYQRVKFRDQIAPFTPPEGSVALDAEAPLLPQYDPAVDALVNPTNPADFKSVERGQKIYKTYCIECHGAAGMGDGPVSMASPQKGPFAGVFPLVTAMGRSDGYIYNLIRGGGQRMPNYRRIPPEDRWHLVNYVRYLQRGGRP
jgi:mono/diheme cytochrome c family protein